MPGSETRPHHGVPPRHQTGGRWDRPAIATLGLLGILALAGTVAVSLAMRRDPGGESLVTVTTAVDSPAGDSADEPASTDVPPGQDPVDVLGSNETLNRLARGCFDGDMGTCDDLYRETPVGSDLETYAQTCGGRTAVQDAAPWCVVEFVDVGEPQSPDAIPEDAHSADMTFADAQRFELLAQRCFGGRLGACDKLYLETPVGSGYEAYGSTCGGRLLAGIEGDCQDALDV